uniref:Uncharacterized protein n=1 Tax=Anguilla anguilla TaxID=7936 RepID=A0A0E9QHF6_ANGAN
MISVTRGSIPTRLSSEHDKPATDFGLISISTATHSVSLHHLLPRSSVFSLRGVDSGTGFWMTELYKVPNSASFWVSLPVEKRDKQTGSP